MEKTLREKLAQVNDEFETGLLTQDEAIDQQIELVRRIVAEPSAAEIVKAMFSQVNGPSSQFEQVIREHLRTEHNTLQQAFVRHVVKPALERIVQNADEGWVDARNESAVRFARKALSAAEDEYLPCI